jgi:hypothetical protein
MFQEVSGTLPKRKCLVWYLVKMIILGWKEMRLLKGGPDYLERVFCTLQGAADSFPLSHWDLLSPALFQVESGQCVSHVFIKAAASIVGSVPLNP